MPVKIHTVEQFRMHGPKLNVSRSMSAAVHHLFNQGQATPSDCYYHVAFGWVPQGWNIEDDYRTELAKLPSQ